MKIISKYKDYYDYLSGIWGEDPKIILDRRKHQQYEFFNNEDDKIGSIFLCGYQIDFVYKKGKFIYLDELKDYYKVYRHYFSKDSIQKVHVGNYSYALTEIIKDEKQYNIKENCPILLRIYSNDFFHYPKLQDLDFIKVMKPEDIYLKLSEYLSPKEVINNNQTDIEKLITHGFDKKISFRNIK